MCKVCILQGGSTPRKKKTSQPAPQDEQEVADIAKALAASLADAEPQLHRAEEGGQAREVVASAAVIDLNSDEEEEEFGTASGTTDDDAEANGEAVEPATGSTSGVTGAAVEGSGAGFARTCFGFA